MEGLFNYTGASGLVNRRRGALDRWARATVHAHARGRATPRLAGCRRLEGRAAADARHVEHDRRADLARAGVMEGVPLRLCCTARVECGGALRSPAVVLADPAALPRARRLAARRAA
eukprot:1287934-Prymnesium_polylepis.1